MIRIQPQGLRIRRYGLFKTTRLCQCIASIIGTHLIIEMIQRFSRLLIFTGSVLSGRFPLWSIELRGGRIVIFCRKRSLRLLRLGLPQILPAKGVTRPGQWQQH